METTIEDRLLTIFYCPTNAYYNVAHYIKDTDILSSLHYLLTFNKMKEVAVYYTFLLSVLSVLSTLGALIKPRNLRLYKAESPNKIYTILEKNTSCPPKIVATKSNSKSPTSSQFNPPTLKRIRALLSNAVIASSRIETY